jgi:uncharacterized protein YijF (DUF1287 family)
MSAKLSIGFLGLGRKRRMVRLLFALSAILCLITWTRAQESAALGPRIVVAARQQIGVTKEYDPAYVALGYPGGDVPLHTGVCSDVVVRALRHVGLDLQKEVHEDMRRNFSAYPQKWGLRGPDKNIDHRRVPNLMRYCERNQIVLKEKLRMPETYQPGDIVAWDLGNGILHIGIVSDRTSKQTPLIFHNIGRGTREEDILFQHRVIGHYRLKEVAPNNAASARSTTNRVSPAAVSGR